MHYYFPINIDGRRLHYFKLEDHGENTPVPKYSFVVKVHDNVSLLSIGSDEPYLICSERLDGNVLLTDYQFRIEKASQQPGNLPTYIIHIDEKKSKTKTEVNDNCLLKSLGRMGTEDHAVVKMDHTCAFNKEKQLTEPVIHLVISYLGKDNKTYTDAVKFYFYTDDHQLTSAALDFGSEASQIRFGGSDSNLPVIDTLLEFNDGDTDSKADQTYWQGRCGDLLYKSVFFIHTAPTKTEYAQKPIIGLEKRAFVQPLLDSTTRRPEYAPLELLPNLKLVEIGADAMALPQRRIMFEEGSNIEVGAFPNLASRPLRDSILRIILSNFLHCVLKVINDNRSNKFLRMVLMVPNVYYQSKINQLVRDLYEDYSTIQNEETYPHCKGFEVQVVSESDAAFLGVRNKSNDTKHGKNELFLIIDAGKGTTDFSILQQHEDFSKYSSMYRDGIPASGNALTYAFHEALHAFMSKYSIRLNAMLKSAEKAELLQYMSCLERFKQTHGKTAGECIQPSSNNIKSMATLVSYLENELAQRHSIPESESYIQKKIDLLCECLERSISQYMNGKKTQFLQVLLTGRGFLFIPFRQAIIEMLLKNGWLKEKEDVILTEDEVAKTICLSGALSIEKECSVNGNSGLIGSPIIETTKDYSNKFQRMAGRLFKKRRRAKEIDLDFFYQGSDQSSSRNVTVIIGGRTYPPISSQEREDKVLFYTGEGFICLKESSCDILDERNFQFSDSKIRDLVLESLFPFHPDSIRDDNDMTPFTPSAEMKASASQGTRASQTGAAAPQDAPKIPDIDDMDK